jgi:hypothetical protein
MRLAPTILLLAVTSVFAADDGVTLSVSKPNKVGWLITVAFASWTTAGSA